MTEFTLYTQEDAPERSKQLLEKSMNLFGMIPGLHAVMAESPEMLETYQMAHDSFSNSSFSDEETTVVWQSINVENECHYCVPAHTGIAKSMGVSDQVNDALRDQTPLPSLRLEVLRNFTLSIVRQRGHVDDEAVNAFLDAGFTKQQVLEVVLGYAQKVMSNYTNYLAKTPIDRVFEKFKWQPK